MHIGNRAARVSSEKIRLSHLRRFIGQLDEWVGLKSLFDDRIDFAPLTTESRMSTIVSHRGSNVFHD
jgi:hypothetical protein